jgi:hypothetical protein
MPVARSPGRAVLGGNLLVRRKGQAVHGSRSRAWRVVVDAMSIIRARPGPRSLASARVSWIRGGGLDTSGSGANRARSVDLLQAEQAGPIVLVVDPITARGRTTSQPLSIA